MTDDEGKQIRDYLLDNTFANYGSGETVYLTFTSSSGGWYGAMKMSMGSCDFVYSYDLNGRKIELTYTGSNCDAAFQGGSQTMTFNHDNSISVYMHGQQLKFTPI